jgi:hypothetical protein
MNWGVGGAELVLINVSTGYGKFPSMVDKDWDITTEGGSADYIQ